MRCSAGSSTLPVRTGKCRSWTIWFTSADCCPIAQSHALQFAQNQLVATLHDQETAAVRDMEAQRELEAFAAGLKVVSTWHASAAIQEAREACGGAGYLAENRLVELRADTDVFTTFEGDNHVLLQLVAKHLLTSYNDDIRA